MPYDSSTFDGSDETPVSALDRPLTITKFTHKGAKSKTELRKSLRELVPLILESSAPSKEKLPWLKLAQFGEIRTAEGSLRSNANVLAIEGIEGDHDAGTMQMAKAAALARAEGVAALFYTSPSHTPEAPRWRVVCPTTGPLPPKERERLCACLNGILEGALAGESFVLSQSYYFGNVRQRPICQVELVEGKALDLVPPDTSICGPLGKDGKAYRPAKEKPAAKPRDAGEPDGQADWESIKGDPDWARIKSALDAIPPDERDKRQGCWLPIGIALHHESGGSEEGYAHWVEWCGSKYAPQEQRRHWQSFQPRPENPITIATLYHIAKQRGWQPSQQARAAGLQVSKSGAILSNLRNALHLLRTDPALSGLLAFDQMQCSPMLMRPVPRYPADALDAARPWTPRLVEDGDVTALLDYLQGAGLSALGWDVLHRAADLRAAERAFHPVRDYLNGLAWDGLPRLGRWLTTYLNAEATPYTNAIGRMFLIAMAARVFKPGCKVDYMPILEGMQGAGKSAVCRILGGAWFSDALPDLDGDQVRLSMHLRGKWLIEPAELSAMSRAETATLKAFITREVESFTPKYGRREVREPRQCVFLGTINPDGNGYLKDSTGGRRFWPVEVGDALDMEGLARDRDQLFAEAVAAFRAGEHWWPDRDLERQHIAPQQQARREADAWQDVIGRWLDDQAGLPVTVPEVAWGALGVEVKQLSPRETQRITRCLKDAEWVPRRNTVGRWWEPAPEATSGTHDTGNDTA